MHYGKTNRKADYNLGGVKIVEVSEEKDLGVTFDQQLSFDINASKVVAGTNSRLGLINRHLETKPFMNLYKTLIRPKVEYCMTVTQPVYKKDKEKIERVQRRATKLVKGMENKAYSERLEELKLPSLEYRRKRADVIQTYIVERSSSVVECRTRNRESPGSNPPLLPFRRLGIFRSLHRRPCSLSCINEYLAIDSGGNVSDLVLARNCCVARMLPGEAENGVGMNRSVREGKKCEAL